MTKEKLITTNKSIKERHLDITIKKQKVMDTFIPEILDLERLMLSHRKLVKLFSNKNMRRYLLVCAGITNKSTEYFSEEDIKTILNRLYNSVKNLRFKKAIKELLIRYLIQKGESFGGSIRNKIGKIGYESLVENMIKLLKEKNIQFHWYNKWVSQRWIEGSKDSLQYIVKNANAIAWTNNNKYRILLFNENVSKLNKNVDIIMIDSSIKDFFINNSIVNNNKVIMMGEIKSGIDLFNADEHWKTAYASLIRIKECFNNTRKNIKISLVIGAVTNFVAEEIIDKLNKKELDYAVNITNKEELLNYCNWIFSL